MDFRDDFVGIQNCCFCHVDLEQIFGKDRPGQLKPEELDAFWEAALDAPESKTAGAVGISYEQARQMGLAPKDD